MFTTVSRCELPLFVIWKCVLQWIKYFFFRSFIERLKWRLISPMCGHIVSILFHNTRRFVHSKISAFVGGRECVYAQSCLALCSPMDCGCSAHEISRQEYWNKLPFPTPGNLSVSGVKSSSLLSPAWADGFFTTAPPEGLKSLYGW